MAYVTEDRRVQEIIGRMNARQITRKQAAEKIKALPPQERARAGYLDWEVDEALKAVRL